MAGRHPRRGRNPSTTESRPPPPGQPSASEEDGPDWLADLRQKMGDELPHKDDSVPPWADVEEEAIEPEPEPFELPDWIAEGPQGEEEVEEEADELDPAEL